MAEVYFPESVDNFIRSLGRAREDVLADLLLVARVGPEDLDFCEDQTAISSFIAFAEVLKVRHARTYATPAEG